MCIIVVLTGGVRALRKQTRVHVSLLTTEQAQRHLSIFACVHILLSCRSRISAIIVVSSGRSHAKEK